MAGIEPTGHSAEVFTLEFPLYLLRFDKQNKLLVHCRCMLFQRTVTEGFTEDFVNAPSSTKIEANSDLRLQ